MGREHDAAAIRAAAHELTGAPGDFDALIDRVGDAGCVLLGESTHGTAEFYAVRAHITQRLVEEKGFGAVAVEADWPDAQRADRWARGASEDPDAATALADFARFPRWTWRNHEVVAFLQWLREHNAHHRADVGFYGLDLYSLPASNDGVDAPFFAEQRARLLRNAERYHRATERVGPEAWNLRERHMADTLDAVRTHVGQDAGPGKVVVWAHNSHVGDARATEVAELAQVTLGQLAREHYGDDAVLAGLSTHSGTVTAAADWGAPATTMRLPPARDDSTDALLHEAGPAHLLLVMGEDARATAALRRSRLQRAIGAIYRPHAERIRHYVFANVTRQFDVLIHLDTTSALAPLESDGDQLARPLKALPPETHPTGV